MAKQIHGSIVSAEILGLYLTVLCALTGSLVNAASIGTKAFRSDSCDSPIYCRGDILKIVQLSRIFDDSKTFVDHVQINDTSVTVDNFEKMMAASGGNPSRVDVQDFVEKNFVKMNELIDWLPTDWQSNPKFLQRIADPDFREWAKDLNELWKMLSKKMAPSVAEFPDRHSLIPVNNSFIVPGGRFQEFYYWDSYWVVEGLLLHGMTNTTKGILENFLSMIDRYGFIPNGGRVYYLMRSHPPLLIPMIDLYLEHTKDFTFLRKNLETLEKEFAYFDREKTVDVVRYGEVYRMARYVVSSDGPRPESYREDYNLAINISDEAAKRTFYEDLKAGAESGWDFSSRWFISENGSVGDLADISTRNIIPVDLNAFLQRNARLLSQYNIHFGDITKAKYYKDKAIEYQRGIDNVLWNEKEGVWLDYNMKNSRPRNNFYPSNLSPLYTKSFDPAKATILGNRAALYLKRNRVQDFMGGTPASMIENHEQWDFPNAWAPLQSIIVQGLRNSGSPNALSLAKELAIRWLRANYYGYARTGQMFEKYDATNAGESGGGGEYLPQAGFGWTNGVVLEFLNSYPNATYSDDFDNDVDGSHRCG